LGTPGRNLFILVASKTQCPIAKRNRIVEHLKKNVCTMESFPPKFETFAKEGDRLKATRQYEGTRGSKK
jgi:hypothetical protein